jgi:hypothetical protein
MVLSEYNLSSLFTASREKRAEILRMYISCHGLGNAEAEAMIAPLLAPLPALKFEVKLNEVIHAITFRILNTEPPS